MKQNKMVAIIQAHMSSSRLPGKIMRDLCGAPALYRVVERVRQCKLVDEIVVATSTMDCDDEIEKACQKWNVKTFRGSDNDVLARYWGAAQAYPAENYIRLTSDCPLIDAGILTQVIQFFLANDYAYVTAAEGGKGVRYLANGMDCEIFTAELLREAYENATEGYEREHVTPYMYYTNKSVGYFPYTRDESKYRLTLDTPEDYALIKHVYEALYQPGNTFTLDEIIAYLDQHPEVLKINAEIQQKQVK